MIDVIHDFHFFSKQGLRCVHLLASCSRVFPRCLVGDFGCVCGTRPPLNERHVPCTSKFGLQMYAHFIHCLFFLFLIPHTEHFLLVSLCLFSSLCMEHFLFLPHLRNLESCASSCRNRRMGVPHFPQTPRYKCMLCSSFVFHFPSIQLYARLSLPPFCSLVHTSTLHSTNHRNTSPEHVAYI